MGGIKKFWDLPTAINWMFAHLQRNYDSCEREEQRDERQGIKRTLHGRRIAIRINSKSNQREEIPFISQEDTAKLITEFVETSEDISLQNMMICGDDRHESSGEIVHIKSAAVFTKELEERNASLQGILGCLGKGATARDATGTIITATRVIPREEQIRIGNNIFIKKEDNPLPDDDKISLTDPLSKPTRRRFEL